MSFDLVTKFYDRLAILVFGKTWLRIQAEPAEKLDQHRHILIVGGGTGAILPHLSDQCEVTYVELSKKMIQKAKRRKYPDKTNFIHADFLTWNTALTYEAILMPFFLDCFDEQGLEKAILKASSLLKLQGELHVVDFQHSTLAKNILIKIMYLFFGLASGIRGKRLLNMNQELINLGFRLDSKIFYLKGWVFFASYQLEFR